MITLILKENIRNIDSIDIDISQLYCGESGLKTNQLGHVGGRLISARSSPSDGQAEFISTLKWVHNLGSCYFPFDPGDQQVQLIRNFECRKTPVFRTSGPDMRNDCMG